MLAAIHLNDPPGNITLNDHPPAHPRNTTLWAEIAVLQAAGVKVLGMLGLWPPPRNIKPLYDTTLILIRWCGKGILYTSRS